MVNVCEGCILSIGDDSKTCGVALGYKNPSLANCLGMDGSDCELWL